MSSAEPVGDRRSKAQRSRGYIERHHPYRWEEMLAFPKYIDIEPINTCNARCTMCGIDFDHRSPARMEATLFDKITAELAEHIDEIERVGLLVNSEPMMDRRLAEKVGKLKRAGIRRTFITTNASLLSRTRGEELLRAGLDVIYISIDSLDPEAFDRRRPGLSFDVVYRNTRDFVHLRNSLRPGAIIRITMVQLEEDRREAEDFVAHWAALLSAHDQIVVTRGYNWGTANDVVAHQGGTDDPENRVPCLGLWTSMSIDVSGEVRMCCADQEGTTLMGDLRVQSIAEVWHGAELARIRQLHLEGRRREVAMCDGCPIWSPSKHVLRHDVQAEPVRATNLG